MVGVLLQVLQVLCQVLWVVLQVLRVGAGREGLRLLPAQEGRNGSERA